MKDRVSRILSALDHARHNFWAEFASHFPEITTGDFPPDASVLFDEATEAAVNVWINHNPSRLICRHCYTCCTLRTQSLRRDMKGVIWLKCNECFGERKLTLEDLTK